MKIRRIAWAWLVFPAACASAPGGGAGATLAARAAAEPLRVLVEPRGPSGWDLQVNDSVQVAIFEIVPSLGAGMLSPTDGEAEWVGPGRHQLLTRSGVITRHRATYLDQVSGALGGPPSAAVQRASRRVVVAFACVCELELAALAEPDGPRHLLGPFASISEPRAVARIGELILPGPDAEWALSRWFAPR